MKCKKTVKKFFVKRKKILKILLSHQNYINKKAIKSTSHRKYINKHMIIIKSLKFWIYIHRKSIILINKNKINKKSMKN